ncbi:MAG: hypothetical protein ABIA12_02280, partial [Candidatus Aenigmatarchaeota archaeon]
IQLSEWTTWIIVVAVAVVALAFLLWPGKGYSPRTGSYTFKSPPELGKQTVDDIKARVEALGTKIPGLPKKSFAPAKLQPQPQQLPQASYQPASAGYSFKPRLMVPVTGRFAAQQSTLAASKPGLLEAVSQKLSGIKDMFKRKKEEVELVEQ